MFQLRKKLLFPVHKNIVKKLFTSKLNNDSFINGTTGVYIERMHELWKKDPKSVHNSWDIYFSSLENGLDFQNAFQSPPTIDKGNKHKNLKLRILYIIFLKNLFPQ